jgi:ubiquitin-conjugating enzyme E2 D/E
MSQFDQQSTVSEDDWVTADSIALDLHWIQNLFPDKPQEKVLKWLQTFQDNEFDTVDELLTIDSDEWRALALPLAVETKIRREIVKSQEIVTDRSAKCHDAVTESQHNLPSRDTSQIDIIVVDISASMKAKSTLDIDKTREDVSKMLFHTMIDKLICLELYHAVGLLAFGEELHPYDITTEYEQFHDFLGRLDANEGGTKLYDSIYRAADLIDAYVAAHPVDNEKERKKRIFVLTDGEDNRSVYAPWQVAQSLQQRSISLDAIPVAKHNPKLQSMCTATHGLCFKANNQEQAINLFEREAILHVSYREASGKNVIPIVDMASLTSLEEPVTADGSSSSTVTEICSATPSSVSQPVMKKEDITQAVATGSPPTGTSCNRGVLKRILKEYNSFQQNPIPGWNVYINANDMTSWKAILNDDTMPAPYTDGMWLLTIDFPPDYPFKAPKIKFITPIYHCNVSSDGKVCIDILRENWNPAITVPKALASITSLLLNPNAQDPIDSFKGQLYKDDREAYVSQATLHTQKYAAVENEVIAKLLSLNDGS